jgi:hypothetical protein
LHFPARSCAHHCYCPPRQVSQQVGCGCPALPLLVNTTTIANIALLVVTFWNCCEIPAIAQGQAVDDGVGSCGPSHLRGLLGQSFAASCEPTVLRRLGTHEMFNLPSAVGGRQRP